MLLTDVPMTVRYDHVTFQNPISSISDLCSSAQDFWIDPGLYRSQPISPAWVQAIERTVRESTAAPHDPVFADGRWLSPDVAEAATRFFRVAGDLLPSKPFIYSAPDGSLIAEMVAPRGTLTAAVSPTFVLLFSVVHGNPLSAEVPLDGDVRLELQRLLKPLLAGGNGNLAAGK